MFPPPTPDRSITVFKHVGHADCAVAVEVTRAAGRTGDGVKCRYPDERVISFLPRFAISHEPAGFLARLSSPGRLPR